MKKIDLHFHSNYSDGALTPAQLVKKFKQHALKIVSLTDHNNIQGVAEITELARKEDIKVIPGIELYARLRGKDFHILGYGMDIKNKKFIDFLDKLFYKNRQRADKAMRSLQKSGFHIPTDFLKNIDQGYISLGPIINKLKSIPENKKRLQKILKKDHFDLWDVLDKYFSNKKFSNKIFWEETFAPTEDVIDAIKKAGGIAILAHPGQQLTWNQDDIILKLKSMGIDGLEAFSPHHNWHVVEHYYNFACRNNLLITGGTDYHNDLEQQNTSQILKNQWDYYNIPEKIYSDLKKYL